MTSRGFLSFYEKFLERSGIIHPAGQISIQVRGQFTSDFTFTSIWYDRDTVSMDPHSEVYILKFSPLIPGLSNLINYNSLILSLSPDESHKLFSQSGPNFKVEFQVMWVT